jgi:deazaflavin-dependent oxidoreductase (nitroreductase family)
MNTLMKIGNFFIRLILTSPLHGLRSKNTLLVNFSGRRSGKQYKIPVTYTQEGDTIRFISHPKRVWWRNLKTMPEVVVTVRGKQLNGTAAVLETPEEVADGLARFLRPAPQMAKYYKVKIDENGDFDQTDLRRNVDTSIVIEISLQ